MALIKCKDCRKEISSDAPVCPHCGKPISKQSQTATGCLIVIVFFVILSVIGRCSDKNSKPESASAPAAAPPVATDLNDAKALDEKYGTDALVNCEVGADDYLRAASKFAFKWDEIGFFEHKFDQYRSHASSPGILTMVSDKASLQNGFGAYQRIELACKYDTQAKKVLEYSIR
jgi:hypothetical protein